MAARPERLEWDYVIVGSGAGGGTLAARLAEAGMRVFLLEAGGDPRASERTRLPDDYDVPAFHAFACENPAISWNFQVRHYADEAQQARDPKYETGAGRAVSARRDARRLHRAQRDDLHAAARLRLEPDRRAHRRPLLARRPHAALRPARRGLPAPAAVARAAPCRPRPDRATAGTAGCAPRNRSPGACCGDDGLVRVVRDTTSTFTGSLPTPLRSAWRWLRGGLGDPNARRSAAGSFEGLCYTPLTTAGHRRAGMRERLLDGRRGSIRTGCTSSSMRWPRACCSTPTARPAASTTCKGAAPLPRPCAAQRRARASAREVRARREVILCGGAFNTPQLLMLSGIGPAAELRAHGIALRVDLPGVGRNLQDRYEVGV